QVIADADAFVDISHAENPDDVRRRIYQAILIRLGEQQSGYQTDEKTVKTINFKWVAAAAAVVFIAFSLIGYLYRPSENQPAIPTASVNSITIEDVSPGGNKAILKLADGREIVLERQEKGFLTRVGNVTISKSIDGLLAYNVVTGRQVFADSRIHYHVL